MQRPADLDDVSYYTFLQSYGYRAPYNLRTCSLDCILNYFPRYPADEVENYGRAKLMLHYPFRKPVSGRRSAPTTPCSQKGTYNQ
jgi:hypothetical protein